LQVGPDLANGAADHSPSDLTETGAIEIPQIDDVGGHRDILGERSQQRDKREGLKLPEGLRERRLAAARQRRKAASHYRVARRPDRGSGLPQRRFGALLPRL
jgi:hypothetical protein